MTIQITTEDLNDWLKRLDGILTNIEAPVLAMIAITELRKEMLDAQWALTAKPLKLPASITVEDLPPIVKPPKSTTSKTSGR